MTYERFIDQVIEEMASSVAARWGNIWDLTPPALRLMYLNDAHTAFFAQAKAGVKVITEQQAKVIFAASGGNENDFLRKLSECDLLKGGK